MEQNGALKRQLRRYCDRHNLTKDNSETNREIELPNGSWERKSLGEQLDNPRASVVSFCRKNVRYEAWVVLLWDQTKLRELKAR